MASIGDAPIAIIACLALALGVVLAARGRRGEQPLAEAAAAHEEPAAAPAPSVPAASAATPTALALPAAPAPPAAPPPPAPAVGHGPIRFVTRDEPVAPGAVEPERPAPAAVAAEPEPAPFAAPEPQTGSAPEDDDPPPATPQPPPTTFRQGAIKIGGLDRRK
jgi:hypothetical protein